MMSTLDTRDTRDTPDTAHSGDLYCIADAALLLGMKYDTLYRRIRRHATIKPRRLGERVLVLTTADLMTLWTDLEAERGQYYR